jgi:hypothetical protein
MRIFFDGEFQSLQSTDCIDIVAAIQFQTANPFGYNQRQRQSKARL